MTLSDWIAAGSSLLTVAGGLFFFIRREIRASIATFHTSLIEDFDERYLRKPDLEEDYPVSRRELAYRLKNGVHSS